MMSIWSVIINVRYLLYLLDVDIFIYFTH
uniref:Uncharacterized protein n=1 Tax=Musa acuminata subsp. malaccensis TaxID=214687 RepID=A0A804KG16_MUSAM